MATAARPSVTVRPVPSSSPARSCLGLFGLLLAGAAVAQAPSPLALGATLQVPPDLRWHTPIPAATAAVVWCVYAAPAVQHRLPWEGAALAAVRAAVPDAAVVVVVEEPAEAAPPILPRGWRDVHVASLPPASAAAWLGDERGSRWHVAVAAADGQVRFVGQPGAGLRDAVLAANTAGSAATAAPGTDWLAAEQERFLLRRLPGFDAVSLPAVVRQLADAVIAAPGDGCLAGLLVVCQAHRGDPAAAMAAAAAAPARFGGEPAALARFADLALRSEVGATVAPSLVAPLLAACDASPDAVPLGLATLRALAHTQRERDFGRTAMRVRKAAFATAATTLEFAEILTQTVQPEVHLDLARAALQRADELGAEPRLAVATRVQVLLRCAGDRRGAQALLDDYLDALEPRSSRNNDCWYFLTELATLGRYDLFAEQIADAMLASPTTMDYFEFDTVAFARYRRGRFAEAVELQKQALAKAGREDPEYRARLQRYELLRAAR